MTKITQTLLLALLSIALLIVLKGFLIPLAYGLLIALIVYPICKKLEKRSMPRAAAAFSAVMVVAIVFLAVIFVFYLQVLALGNELPALTLKLTALLADLQNYIYTHFGISIIDQDNMLISTGKNMSADIGKMLSSLFYSAIQGAFNLVIIPLYAALILIYRRTLVDFAETLVGDKMNVSLSIVLNETIHIYFNYIKGMLMVYIIVGILNSIGLLILGVKYAILFGVVTAFMTIIPYFGIIVSALLPLTMVWIETNNVWYPMGVVAVFATVQYLEANIIFPYIVGKQLGLNTLVSIAAILLGGSIWGISGMILFLPFVALTKLISGHVESLKALSVFLDNPVSTSSKKAKEA